MAKRLEYEITTDPSKGIAGLKQFNSAVKKSMKDVGDSTDGATTNAQKLAKTLAGMADDLEAEMKKAAKAADALGKALGPEISQRTDLDSVVQDLKKMGISFDEITDDADALAASLKRLDQVQLSGAGRGMEDIANSSKRAKDGVDDIGKSADSSKSVLANMVGNSVQDLGALGGVAGTAGVAIGQMGEYMADAAASGEGLGSIVTNFATVAGPIAALSVGMGLITKVIGDIQKKNEEIAKNSKDIAAGITEDFAKIETAADTGVQSITTLAQAVETNFAKTQDNAGRTVLAVKELGTEFGGLGDILIALDQGDAGRLQWMENFLNGSDKVVGANKEISAAVAQAIVDGEDFGAIYNKAFNFGGKAAADFVEKNKAVIESLEQIDDASENISIDQIVKDTTDELLNAKGGTEAWMKALAELPAGASKLQILNRALQIYTGNTGDAADAQKKFDDKLAAARDDWEAQKEAIADAAQAVADYNDAINSADWKMAGLTGATQGLQNFASAQFDATDAILDVESAIDDLGKTWKDTGVDMKKTTFAPDFSTEDGRKIQKALEGVARAVDEQLGPAFADAGGDFDTFMKDAQRITDQTLGPLQKEFDLSKTQVEELRKQLGLTAGDWEAKFKLSMDEEARVKLGLIQSAIDGLDKPTQMKIGAQIVAGDIQGALATAQAAFADPDNPVNMPVVPVAPTPEQIALTVDAVTQYIMTHPMPTMPIAVTLDDTEFHRRLKALQDFIVRAQMQGGVNLAGLDAGGTAGGFGGIAGERGPEILNDRYLTTRPVYIPPGTKVTSRKRTEQILRTRGTRGLKRYDSGGIVPRATSVTINAAVIGSTFDVMHAVSDAVRRAERLLPRHQ